MNMPGRCARGLLLVLLSVVAAQAGASDPVTSGATMPAPPLDAESLAVLARADVWLGGWNGDTTVLEAAGVEILRVLERHPESAEAHRSYAEYLLGAAMHTSSDYEPEGLAAAGRELDIALRLDPGDRQAALLRARVYRHQSRLGDARTALESVEKQGTDWPGLHDEWANLLMEEKRPEDALARCQRIAGRGQASRDMADSCAITPLWTLQRYDEAERLYDAILERNPHSAWEHGNRARFLLCGRREPVRAIESASHALALMEYGSARLTLAAARYLRWAELVNDGRPADADLLWVQAAATMEGDPARLVETSCGGDVVLPVLKALHATRRSVPLSPAKTIHMAAEVFPGWLPAEFALEVRGKGRGHGREAGHVFLNSEADYRDPRSVTVRILPEAAAAYRAEHGEDPDVALAGKSLVVYGLARRIRIDYFSGGVPNGRYYYQTQIVVNDPGQIEVVDPALAPPPPAPVPGVKA